MGYNNLGKQIEFDPVYPVFKSSETGKVIGEDQFTDSTGKLFGSPREVVQFLSFWIDGEIERKPLVNPEPFLQLHIPDDTIFPSIEPILVPLVDGYLRKFGLAFQLLSKQFIEPGQIAIVYPPNGEKFYPNPEKHQGQTELVTQREEGYQLEELQILVETEVEALVGRDDASFLKTIKRLVQQSNQDLLIGRNATTLVEPFRTALHTWKFRVGSIVATPEAILSMVEVNPDAFVPPTSLAGSTQFGTYAKIPIQAVRADKDLPIGPGWMAMTAVPSECGCKILVEPGVVVDPSSMTRGTLAMCHAEWINPNGVVTGIVEI